MSEDLLQEAPFLSLNAPKESIIDYSRQLSRQAKQTLEQQCSTLNYKAKVVILPSDYSPGSSSSFDAFGQALAQQWHVSGKRFLLIVDLKEHHVRGFSGEGLQNLGVSSDFISTAVIKDSFLKPMRKGDLEGAVSSALSTINTRSLASHTAGITTSTQARKAGNYTQSAGETATSSFGFLFFLVVLFALVAALVFASTKAKKKKSKELYDSLKGRLDSLYSKADAMSQAAEYLNTSQNSELAADIAKFFNRIAALNTAQTELERLDKAGKVQSSYESMRKVEKKTDMLLAEAAPLQAKVNAATGSIQTIQESEQELAHNFEKEAMEAIYREDQEKEKLAAEKREKIAEEERFRRPSWSYDSTYYQPVVVNDPWAGVRDFMLIMNQMEMNHRLNEMNYEMHHHGHSYGQTDTYFDDRRNQSPDAGGSWDSVHSNSREDNNDSSWGDSGGDSSWGDSGGDSGWGDSGGDSGWGDSGGDSGWGDSGGGFDFGGGDGGAHR